MSELLNIKCLEHKINETKNHYGRFAIGPLNIGQGITLGNSLRRTLLSDITGIAITNARINVENNPAKSEDLIPTNDPSVSTTNFHEFSTIPGVRESVLEILLNLKNIVLSDDNTNFKDSPRGFINVEGPYRVTANDLVLPSTINVVDSNQYIATIISEQNFSMEVSIKQGRGITEISNQVEGDVHHNESDLLTIDATYIPIKKVNYIVEEKTIGNDNNSLKEMVILEVWTNGSIEPQAAVSSAIETLADLYRSIQSAIVI